MKRVIRSYRDLLSILMRHAPLMVPMTAAISMLMGLCGPLTLYAQRHIFDDGLLVAEGAMPFAYFARYPVLLIIATVLMPALQSIVVYSWVNNKSQRIIQTHYKGIMLKKLSRMRYEHFENEASAEVIDKAFNRAANSFRHLFPMYFNNVLTSLVSSVGLLIQLGMVRWYLVPAALLPFIAQAYWNTKHSYNIYLELESYWNREKRYETLAGFLKTREYLHEGKLNGSAEHLIHTYQTRLGERNRDL